MYIKRNLSTQKYHMWQPVFSSLDHITSHDHALTSSDLFDLLTSRIDSTKINKSIGMLQVIGKLKKAAFYALYGSASLRSNDWPQADLHWPLMTSKLCILEHMHDVYQKKEEHLRIPYVRNFFLFWTIWPLMILTPILARRCRPETTLFSPFGINWLIYCIYHLLSFLGLHDANIKIQNGSLKP